VLRKTEREGRDFATSSSRIVARCDIENCSLSVWQHRAHAQILHRSHNALTFKPNMWFRPAFAKFVRTR
jgi:hypothetical protein